MRNKEQFKINKFIFLLLFGLAHLRQSLREIVFHKNCDIKKATYALGLYARFRYQ